MTLWLISSSLGGAGNIGVVLPSCAVTKIRSVFPSNAKIIVAQIQTDIQTLIAYRKTNSPSSIYTLDTELSIGGHLSSFLLAAFVAAMVAMQHSQQ